MAEEFAKLKIQAYDNPDYSGSHVAEFVVMFNPDNYSDKLEIEYEGGEGSGTSKSPQKFKGIKPRDLSLEFTIDGTGVTGPIQIGNQAQSQVAEGENQEVDVAKKIKEFKDVCSDFHGSEHRPYFLHIIWGELSFACVLKSLDIKYTLFKRDGKPLRAKLNCTFAEAQSDKAREKEEKRSSPDLTHLRTVLQGDTLPLMAYRIYGDSKYYMEIARVNKLKDFRKLTPGQQLVFPPIDKTQN